MAEQSQLEQITLASGLVRFLKPISHDTAKSLLYEGYDALKKKWGDSQLFAYVIVEIPNGQIVQRPKGQAVQFPKGGVYVNAICHSPDDIAKNEIYMAIEKPVSDVFVKKWLPEILKNMSSVDLYACWDNC